ncbi:class I SAM-dependent methyltransferase [Mycobacterium sp.]|uniref:class I SAM-dependent methyltransferase n=1 Tax=Mycobacterium sp. TaxID=1785 RepID=UPI00126DDC47|nr:class I SAM-dependent methyltransferase [Mycobacterium sp.]KAA8966026.1 MAG: methyltransferase domain-containing protein [Mycobacterium sp.]
MLALDTLVNEGLVICPRCANPVRITDGRWRCTDSSCRYAETPFPTVAGAPVLVDFEHSVLDADRLRSSQGASPVAPSRLRRLLSRLLHPPNTIAGVNVARMLELLRADHAADDAGTGRGLRILVIGGGTTGDGLAALYADPTVDLIAFDIYVSPMVQFVADGHAIPLADGSVDGVVIQAVLEHVLEPPIVAREIHRVLRSGGIVYADTPFLQHVHMGPYDFTRFTDSGHRYLFRSFDCIDSGCVAGAGTALRWSLDCFVRALTRSARLGKITAASFFWLSWFDRILDPRHSLDGASAVFFLGRKSAEPISRAEIIDYYQGGM